METNMVEAYRKWLESNIQFAGSHTRWWQRRKRSEQRGRATAYAYALYEFNKRFAGWDGSGAALLERHGEKEAVIRAARGLVAPNVYGAREYLIDRIADLDAAEAQQPSRGDGPARARGGAG